MADAIPVPMLSPAGWTTSPSEKADALFSHFFEALKSQTALYGDNVASLQWIIEQYGHDIITVTRKLQAQLETYLGRYYEVVTVTVTNDNNATSMKGDVTLTVHANVMSGGVQYSVGKLLQISNTKLEKIIALNNLG
ncbi:MAG: hypothetical protein ACD_84C00043G0005 [uncultured bacterium]|nr:MAG: hypothetical protein ACD_84C00043G0005 [uncultured bacterium]